MRLTKDIAYRCVKRNGEMEEKHCVLLCEHAMDIYVDNELYVSVVCTAENLEELVIGRLLSDGMIRSLGEIKTLKISGDESLADVEIREVSCVGSDESEAAVNCPDEWIFEMADVMAEGMPLHEKTWATHSCFLFRHGKLLFSCEDISRHNAVDKVIGYALKNELPFSECAVYSSGRVPADMVDKVWNARIPVLVSKGMPTKQAVCLAKQYRLTLVCGARRDQMRMFVDNRSM